MLYFNDVNHRYFILLQIFKQHPIKSNSGTKTKMERPSRPVTKAATVNRTTRQKSSKFLFKTVNTLGFVFNYSFSNELIIK